MKAGVILVLSFILFLMVIGVMTAFVPDSKEENQESVEKYAVVDNDSLTATENKAEDKKQASVMLILFLVGFVLAGILAFMGTWLSGLPFAVIAPIMANAHSPISVLATILWGAAGYGLSVLIVALVKSGNIDAVADTVEVVADIVSDISAD